MDERRVQLVGQSTFVVSLPKDWADAVGIKRGSRVQMTPTVDGSLMVQPVRPKPAPREIEVDGRELTGPGHLTRRLVSLYLLGATLVRVTLPEGLSPALRRAVRDFPHMVIGPHILEEDARSFVLQDLADASQVPMDKGLRRMHLIVRSMLQDALTAVRTQDRELARDVVLRDADVDRLQWLLRKEHLTVLEDVTIAQRLGTTPVLSFHLAEAARTLERIGDHAENIAKAAVDLGSTPLPPPVLDALTPLESIALSALETATDALFKEDERRANAAIERAEELHRAHQRYALRIRRLRGRPALAGMAIGESLRRTGLYAADLGETAMDLCAAKGAMAGGRAAPESPRNRS